jgi:hypothetical protein
MTDQIIVAWQKTIALNPKPTGWWDHRCEGLAKANAEEVIPHVADGEEDRLSLALPMEFRYTLIQVI